MRGDTVNWIRSALLAFAVGVSPLTSFARGAPDDFASFWGRFRSAAAIKDVGAVKALTRFPLEVGFENDDSHTRLKYVIAAQFDKFFTAELTCPYPYRPKSAHHYKPRIDDVLRQDGPSQAHDGVADIEPYVFSKTPLGWRLTAVTYVDSSEFLARLHGRC